MQLSAAQEGVGTLLEEVGSEVKASEAVGTLVVGEVMAGVSSETRLISVFGQRDVMLKLIGA